MNTNLTNEKIKLLTARSKDKSLTREQRQEAITELNWALFRSDKRPAMSLRRGKLIDSMIWFADACIFGYMGIAENLGKPSSGIGELLVSLTLLLLIASFIVYIIAHCKYKFEPADELASRSLYRASNIAFGLLVGIGLVLAAGRQFLDRGGIMVLQNSSLIFLLCSAVYLYNFLYYVIFFFLDRNAGADEEED